MSTTLAIANQKGGVAKTTTVASVGVALAELGHSVLLVDLDPQSCLTFSLGIDPEDLELSLHHVLTKGLDPAEVLIETEDGVALVPATIELARAEADPLTRTGRDGPVLAELILQRIGDALKLVAVAQLAHRDEHDEQNHEQRHKIAKRHRPRRRAGGQIVVVFVEKFHRLGEREALASR